MEKRFALLIDSENTSVKYIDTILKELGKYGQVTYKRMYGDFTMDYLSEWNQKALEFAIVPIQQPRYSKAKNAADIMLVIDAMDILYTKNVDGFCIVSSDSDFTRLVNRLSEDGMTVIGMGKSDASKTLKTACTEFKNLEKIYEAELSVEVESKQEETETEKMDNASITSLSEIKKNILEIVQQQENKGERAELGGIKSQLQRLYTDFDERNYGYSSMTTFIKDLKEFEMIMEGTAVYVTNSKTVHCREEIELFIINKVTKSPISLGSLGQQIHNQFPEFQCKNYGYSQLWRFVSSIPQIVIEEKNSNERVVKKKI